MKHTLRNAQSFFLVGLFFLMVNLGWGQQVIGNFPYMDGGFENQTLGSLGTSLSTTNWSRQNQSGASSTIVSTSPRSGSKYGTVTNVSTVSRGLQSPQDVVAANGPQASISYVIQYYIRNSGSINSFQLGAVTTNGTTNPSAYPTAAALSANSNWTKQTLVVTNSTTAATSCGIGIAGRSSTGSFDVDDFVVYTGTAVDNTAPSSAGVVSVSGATTSSLAISWGAASGGVDGGGYVVVRYASNPNADNDPNQNGIYAVGNTISNGTGSLVGTVRYIGTGTSFTDNVGLSEGTQYWYKVYTVDKAFNYATESQASGTTLFSNSAPVASSVAISGTLNVGQTLTGSYNYTDADSDTQGTSTFQWYRADDASGTNSVAISGATATTYTLQAADVNKYIRFGVVPVASAGTSPGVEAFSSWQGPVVDASLPLFTLTPDSALTEQNLSSALLTVSLSNVTFVDGVLDVANFTLNNAPTGLTIDEVVYDTPTSAIISLLYDQTDFDTSISNFSVSIAAAELSSAQNLTSSNLSISAVTETLEVSAINSFGSKCLNSETTESFTISGSNLKSGNISLASLIGINYSLDNVTFTSTLTIPSSGGTLAATTVYVKFTPALVQNYDGNIVVSGVGASSVNRSVVGSGINTTPTITTPTSASLTISTAILGGNITVVGCNPITERGVFYSTTNGFADGVGTKVSETGASFTTGAFTMNVSGLLSGTTYYYKAFATSVSGTAYSVQGTFTTTALSAPVATAATNVGDTSFTANWNAVAEATSYVIDVYEKNPIYATDLIISEYVEGSSSNKYIEIFNGTGSIKDLSSYQIRLYANGGTSPSNTESLSGLLLNNQTLVFRNSSASLSGTSGFPTSSVSVFNGDDALAIFNTNTNSLVDIFGRIGDDPGTAWTGTGGYSTLDKTLVRKSNVINGISANPTGTGVGAFTTLTTEWDLYSTDNVTNLGTHAFNPGFNVISVIQNLNVGNVTTYNVTGLNPNKKYYYVVRAADGSSTSVNSNEIEAITDGPFLWTGTTNNLWNVATNWFGGVVPDGSKDVIIASGTPQLNINYNIPTGTSISIEGSGNLNIAAANTLTLVGDLNITSGAEITNLGIIEVSEGTITDNRTTKNYGGTVIYNGSSNQDILGATYNNLEITENNTKSLVANTDVNGTLFLTEGTLNNSTFLTLGNGATINRSGGILNAVPTFSTTVNIIYSENSALITTGNEIPSAETVLNNLTINNTLGVKATGNITVNGILNLTTANPNATNGALEMVIDYTGYAQNPYGTGDYTNSTASFNNLNSYVLTMGTSATTVGIGDVTGKIRRTSLVDNTTYSFGNAHTELRLNSVSGSAIPSQITVVATRGTYGTHIDNTGGVAINGTTANRNAVQRLYQILRTGGDVASRFTLRMAYEDGDLNGNTEANLVSWDHHLPYGAITPHEHGKTSANAIENWVELSNHSVNYLATEGATTFTKYWMLSAKESLNDYEWLGAINVPGQTNWNITENWKSGKIPNETANVFIPNTSETLYDPVIDTNSGYGILDGTTVTTGEVRMRTLEIASGGVLTVASGAAPTITLYGGPNVGGGGINYGSWLNNGTFTAANSTVIFDFDNTATESTIAGSTSFYNVTIANAKKATLQEDAQVALAGTLTNRGILDATTNLNTVIFNGSTDQTVVATNGSDLAYYSLELGGTGVKSFATAPSIKGDFIQSGSATITVPSVITFNGSAAQNIVGLNYNNIVFSEAGTKTFTSNGSLSNTGAVTFSGTPGVVDFDGASDNLTFVLKSDASGTARIGNASNWTINGKVTAERYVPAKRAWRLLTAPLKGTSNATVPNNWQGVDDEGLLLFSPSTYQSQTMTGYTTGGGSPNIWKYDSANTQWQSIPNLTTENLFTSTGNNGFLVFATGPSNSANIVTGEAVTTLRPQGQLITGAVSHSLTADKYHLIGNPYASPLHTEALVQANTNTKVFMVDPSLGTVGGYFTYDGSNWTPTPPSGSEKYIQSGQGFFVRSASNPTFTISESHKAIGNSNTWFERANSSSSSSSSVVEDKIRVLLYKQLNSQWQLADGILTVNSVDGNDGVDAVDTGKMTNFNENIAFRNGTSNLAIEYRGLPTTGTVQQMRLTGTTVQPYQLRVKTENYSNSGLQPYLEDTQAGTFTLIPTDGSDVVVNFTGMAATAAAPDARFRIVYPSALGVDAPDALSVGVYPNPTEEGVFTILLPLAGETARYTLTNLVGQEVQQGTLDGVQSRVSVSTLQGGVYLLQVQQSGKRFATKLIIK